MKIMLCLAALMAIAAYHTRPANSQEPWTAMGVTCDLETKLVTIRDKAGCSKSGVRVKYCRGTCRSGSLFQLEYPYFQLACDCCKKKRTVKRPVLLSCPGNSYKVEWIKYASKCGCERCT